VHGGEWQSRLGLAGSRAVIVLGAVLIAAVLSITSYEIWRQRVVTLQAAEAGLQSLALTLAEQTELAFHSVELVVDASIESVEEAGGIEKSGSVTVHRELRERAVGIPQLRGVALIDAGGNLVNTLTHWPPPAINFSDRDYFRAHRDNPTKALHIGGTVVSRLTEAEIITVSRRIDDANGAFAGVVIATVSPNYFHEAYARVLPGNNSAFALFRSDGMLLARAPQAPGAKLGGSYAHLPDFQPDSPTQGLVRAPSPMDGALRIVAFHSLGNFPLKINLSLDEDHLLAPWRANTLRLVAFALMAMLILTSAVIVLVRHMRREEAGVRQLQDSERRLRLAQFTLDHAADMVFWCTPDGRLIYANHVACQRTGYTLDEMRTLSIADLNPNFAQAEWEGSLDTIRKHGVVRLEARHRCHDGTSFPVDVVVTTVEWEATDYFCAFVRDISDRKQTEAMLAEKTERLEASNAELEQFAYVASHDLREPLRMVNSFVTMLAKRYGDKLDAEARDYIAFAQDGAVRMDRLILDLLEYSRVGRLNRPLAPVPLGQMVDLARKSLLVATAESGAIIEVAPDLPVVLVNEEEIVRLLVNLIANALKYRHPDRAPVVRITAERQGAEVLCQVSDNGIGIDPQYYERIFRIFQRLHGRDRYEGTGIGLAICKKIIERHGGRIWVESQPDLGSTFSFTLKPGFIPSAAP
jgi:PAS domain S-box-containing protein